MSSQTQEKTRAARELTPNVDIFENETELLVVADVPGLDPSEIGVHVEHPDFRIEAKLAGTERTAVYTRSFRIDERIDPEGVKAEYKDGVLRVHLAKSKAFQPRKVAVQAS
jgi:HSP20 family protein